MQKTSFSPSSRATLTRYDLARFATDTLFDRVARVVCEAECLPRKELYESWAVARRVRRRLRGGRVVDLACGHALTAHLMLLIDDASEAALAVDAQLPSSAARLASALTSAWPRLTGRVRLVQEDLSAVRLGADDVVLSIHACGALTDLVLERAVEARARVAVLPCCHDAQTCETGALTGWMDVSLAIDATRVARLRGCGYRVHTQTIPSAIPPKNRLLVAEP